MRRSALREITWPAYIPATDEAVGGGSIGREAGQKEGVRSRLRFSDPGNGGGPTSHTPALDVSSFDRDG